MEDDITLEITRKHSTIRGMFAPSMSLMNAASVAFYCMIGILLFGKSVLFHPFTTYIGVTGDPEQNMWYLGWFWHAVAHGQNPFITTGLNYPNGMNLMSNTSLIAESIILGPLLYLTNAAFTYNVLFLVNFILTAFLGEHILLKFGIRYWLAATCGLLFSILPFLTNQYLGHTHIFIIAPIVGFIYYLFANSRNNKSMNLIDGIVFGILIAIQFYTSLEILFSFIFFCIIFIVIMLFLDRETTVSKIASFGHRYTIITIIIAAVLILPGIYEYLYGPFATKAGTAVHPAYLFSNDYLNVFVPTSQLFIHTPGTNYTDSFFTGAPSEWNGYIGLPMIVVLILTLHWVWHHRFIQSIFYTSLFALILSFGPHLHILGKLSHFYLPWVIFEKLPMFAAVIPARLALFTDIGIVIIIAYGFESYLHSNNKLNQKTLLSAASLGMVIIFWLPVIPYNHTSIPKSSQTIAMQSPLYNMLHNQPTYIITSDFSITMQALADNHYDFPVANDYGFAPVPSLANDLTQNTSYTIDTHLYENQFAMYVPYLQATRVLYLPPDDSVIPPTLYSALTDVLGPPLGTSGNTILWGVPQKIDPHYFTNEFDILYNAAMQFFSNKKNTGDSFYPLYLEQKGYLPAFFGGFDKSNTEYQHTQVGDVILSNTDSQHFSITIITTRIAAQAIFDKYKSKAQAVLFPGTAQLTYVEKPVLALDSDNFGQLQIIFSKN